MMPLRMMMMEMLALLMKCLLDTFTLCHSWQKGEVVLDMRVVILRGAVSIGNFVRGGVDMRDVVRITCIFSSFLYFRYICSYTWVLWPFLTYIVLIFFIYVDVCFFHLSLTCVVSFLSLCICFLLLVCNLLFLFHTKMPWWVLFKVFQKYKLSKSTCHKLSSCKFFQELVLG